MTNDKILCDVDGVCLAWEEAFHQWMRDKGHDRLGANSYEAHISYPQLSRHEAETHVRTFNNSARIVALDTFRDADQGIARLFDHGYKFTAITSLSLDPYAKQLRHINLDNNFGWDAFDDLICLDTGASKKAALEPYRDTGLYWIEDNPDNCDAGLEVGLKPIIIDHPYNQYYDNPDVIRVNTWAEICDIILQEENNVRVS